MTVRTSDKLSELEQLALIDMSYSRLNTYDMCNLQYFYSYIVKEPSQFGEAATLGNILHEVLEIHVGEPLDFKKMMRTYQDDAREKYDPEHKISPTLIADGKTMLTNYIDLHKKDTPNVIGKEKYFEIIVGSVRLRGYIDRVDRLDTETVHIIDYKSGKYKITKKSASTNLQLGIYVLALAHEMPEIQRFKTELYYLRDNSTIGHTFTREDIPAIEERVVGTVKQVLDDTYYHPTRNTRICSFCDHAASGACPVGVARNRRS